jgi:hypothetical protein
MTSVVANKKQVNPIHYREFIRRVKYNIPFGFYDSNNKFRTFVNIDVDEEGNYVYRENSNTYSIAQLIIKEKKLSGNEWFEHIMYINTKGKPAPLSKVSLTIAKKNTVEKKTERGDTEEEEE